MTMIWLIASLCFTCTGVWAVCYWAPHCAMPANPCRQFILISPLHHPDPWGEKADSEPAPWWVRLIEYGSYAVIVGCMIYPTLGIIVLFGITMFMMWRFIQKITESGPYEHNE